MTVEEVEEVEEVELLKIALLYMKVKNNDNLCMKWHEVSRCKIKGNNNDCEVKLR